MGTFTTENKNDVRNNRKNEKMLNLKARFVEILYNEFGENRINVFHAMPCRPRFYYLFDDEETP
jgi:hypothetical protein